MPSGESHCCGKEDYSFHLHNREKASPDKINGYSSVMVMTFLSTGILLRVVAILAVGRRRRGFYSISVFFMFLMARAFPVGFTGVDLPLQFLDAVMGVFCNIHLRVSFLQFLKIQIFSRSDAVVMGL